MRSHKTGVKEIHVYSLKTSLLFAKIMCKLKTLKIAVPLHWNMLT